MAIYALRPLSTGEILDGALTLLRRHFRLVLWIALAFEGVPTVMDVYLDLAGGGGGHPGLALLDRILSATGAMLGTGAPVRVVSEAYLGRTPRLRDALGFAGDKLGAIFGANFTSGILTALALLALVVPGIVVACGYSVAAEVAALASPGSAGAALRRSWDLTKGFKGKALALWLVSVCLILAVFLGAGLLGGVLAALGGAFEAGGPGVTAVGSLFVFSGVSFLVPPLFFRLPGGQGGVCFGNLTQQPGTGGRGQR